MPAVTTAAPRSDSVVLVARVKEVTAGVELGAVEVEGIERCGRNDVDIVLEMRAGTLVE
jgi:hypothetical protein